MREKNADKTVISSVQTLEMKEKRGTPETVFGMLCRFAVAFAGTAGCCLMLNDAFRFTGGIDYGYVFLLCAVFCALFYALFVCFEISRAAGVIFSGLSFAAVLTAVFAAGVETVFVKAPVTVWNRIISQLVSAGFGSLSALGSDMPGCDPLSEHGQVYCAAAFCVFCCVISFVMIFSTFKKVRITPILITAGAVMTVVFTYNLLNENFGFVLTVSFGFAIIVMKYYELFAGAGKVRSGSEQNEKPRGASVFKKTAGAGIAAFITAVAIFAVSLYPALRINTPAPEAGAAGEFVDNIRNYVFDYISGKKITDQQEEDQTDSTQRSIMPKEIKYTGKKIMTVTAKDKTDVYLRSYAADKYSNGEWSVYSPDKITENGGYYAELTGEEYVFTPEDVTELFYTIVDADKLKASRSVRYDFKDIGFINEYINIKTAGLRGNTGYLPSRYLSRYGLTKDGGSSEKVPFEYIYGSTGMVGMDQRNVEYKAAASVPNYKNLSLWKIEDDIKLYNLLYRAVVSYLSAEFEDDYLSVLVIWSGAYGSPLYYGNVKENWQEIKNYLATQASEMGLEIPSGSILSKLDSMDRVELALLYDKIKACEVYNSYVLSQCLELSTEDRALLNSISTLIKGSFKQQSGVFSQTYLSAYYTARYLSDTAEYTLDPAGYDSEISALASFLTDAKNGYCVQYATAGALILRSMGIPARYVEGYKASNAKFSGGEYVFTVKDENAHAWIEAYVRGYGWVTFEMTEIMLDSMYPDKEPSAVRPYIPPKTDPGVETNAPEETVYVTEVTVETTVSAPAVTTEKVLTPDTTEDGGGNVIKIIIITVVSLSAAAAVCLYIMKAGKRKKDRETLIRNALEKKTGCPGADIKAMSAYIFYCLGKLGLRRGECEQFSEFSKRADKQLGGDFSPAAEAINKNAFGHCADKEDCAKVAGYAVFVKNKAVKTLPPLKRFIYSKVRKTI